MILKDIIDIYFSSPAFTKRLQSDKTRKEYKRYLTLFKNNFGHYHAIKTTKSHFINELDDFIEDMRYTPRKAKYFLMVIKSFSTWADKNSFFDNTKIKKITFTSRRIIKDNHWSDDDVELVLKSFKKPLQDFVMLAVETGLRRCDLIQLKYSNIKMINNRPHFVLKQSKTQNMVYIAMSRRLMEYIQTIEKRCEYILTSSNGTPWSENKFNCTWRRAIKPLGLNVTPHGLRKVTVRRLVEADATTAQIAATLGWTLDTVTRMMQDHYFIDKKSVSHIGIEKLDMMRENRINHAQISAIM